MNASSDNSSETPSPVYRAWAEKHGTPWEVTFPKRGPVERKRRFFASQADAQAEIDLWLRDRKPAANLGKRVVDEVSYWLPQLPEGVSIGDVFRFYFDNHSGSSATVKEVCAAFEVELKRKSLAYQRTQKYCLDLVKKELGEDTPFAEIGKARWIKFIKAVPEYWSRYNRKRIAGVLITQAIELEVYKINPLDGFVFEDAPKKRPHILKNEDARIILEYVSDTRPELAPAFILQMFLGIRTAELSRKVTKTKRALLWEDIVFGKKIDVGVEVSKTDSRRIIDFWPEALTSWLAAFQKKSGRVCEEMDLGSIKSNLIEKLNEEREAAGLRPVDFRKNDFRHTAASNVVGFFQDTGKAELYLGHGRDVLNTYYKDYVSEEDAKAFYSMLRPDQPDNVITLSA